MFFGKKRAQFAIEFLIVVMIAMLMTLPLFLIFYDQSADVNKQVSNSQVEKVLSSIRDSANEVYYLGEPSKKTITVYFPQDIKNISLSESSIVAFMESPDGDYEIIKTSDANLTGSLNIHNGIHQITLEAISGQVLITDN
jgi:uncharacterized protein (UPF0333 family)